MKSSNQLSEVNQNVIDSISIHKGQPIPRPPVLTVPSVPSLPSSEKVLQIRALLEHISPNIGHDDWVRALMAIFHETGGSEEGFTQADNWSSGGRDYKGTDEIRTKWRSFRLDVGNPITIATLYQLAEKGGEIQ